MKPDDALSAWAKSRREGPVPEGFTDRVMSAVRTEAVRRDRLTLLLALLARSRSARIAVVLLASAACASRIVGTLSVFFTR